MRKDYVIKEGSNDWIYLTVFVSKQSDRVGSEKTYDSPPAVVVVVVVVVSI